MWLQIVGRLTPGFPRTALIKSTCSNSPGWLGERFKEFFDYAICKLKNEFANRPCLDSFLFVLRKTQWRSSRHCVLVGKEFRLECLSRVTEGHPRRGRVAKAKRSCTGIAREELQKFFNCERSELSVLFI